MQSFDIDPRACHHCSLRDRENVSESEEDGGYMRKRKIGNISKRGRNVQYTRKGTKIEIRTVRWKEKRHEERN